MTAADYTWLISIIIAAVPLYGYAFGKHVGRPALWQYIVPLNTAYYLFYALYLDPRYGGYPPDTVFDYALTILIPLPAFVANVLYVIKTKSHKPA